MNPGQGPPLDMIHSGSARRILILMSETGGGHRTAAEAIQEGLNYLDSNLSITVVDAWKNYFAWPLNRLANGYGWIVNEALWLWKSIWWLDQKPALVNILLTSVYPLVKPGLLRLFETQKPDVIVSVHPLLTLYPLMVLKQAGKSTPFVTVVTDMTGGYHTWYQPQTTLCLVPTEQARTQAINLGIPPDKVEVAGQPVALKFAAGVGAKAGLRRKLGLEPNRPAILIAGGGEGYGCMFEVARGLACRVPQAQLMVVAGRNKTLQKKLESVDWEIPTAIFSFVPNMHELMGAADIFITKAGPGSLSEAFITRLPLILYDYIPGQEENNVHYIEKHKAGVFEPDPQKIAALVLDWLQPGNPALSQMARNAANLARPEAALTIARRIYGLLP